MNQFEDMLNGAMARAMVERKAAATNMRLGQLIEALQIADLSLPLTLSDGRGAHGFMSYRGFYEDLALSPRDTVKTVGDVLAQARAALGEIFHGYKGGDYPMHKESLLWVAPYGESGGNMLTGILVEEARVVIETTLHEDYK